MGPFSTQYLINMFDFDSRKKMDIMYRKKLKMSIKVIMGSWAMFMPNHMLRKVVPDWVNRSQYRNGMGIATIILTGICFIYPELNHSALHLFALPCVGMTLSHVSKKIV